MERKWTPAQKSAIDTRDCNVLVSAAAGSGKTAVLVERIISMITDPDKNIDIDRLVVVTFTKAAAAQMKDKIRKALDSMLDENPGDVNLLRQITLLNNAQITTIDSFCLWIIRNHFPEVNLDPGFRIMDEGEKKLIENDVLEDVLEEFYAEADEEFFNLVDAFGMGRDDSGLVSIIDKIYRFSRSNPWIDEWFDECMLVYDDETYDNPAIKELYDSIKNALSDYRDKYNRLVDICSEMLQFLLALLLFLRLLYHQMLHLCLLHLLCQHLLLFLHCLQLHLQLPDLPDQCCRHKQVSEFLQSLCGRTVRLQEI